jgi:RecB family exonuclease
VTGPIFTFSKAEHAEHCPGSQALPQIPRESEPARRGTVLHTFVRQVAELGFDEALALVPEDMRAAVAEYTLDDLPTDRSGFLAEVAFAIDLGTGEARRLGENIDRRYAEHGATLRDVAGAADFVALLGEDKVEVSDLKTGRSPVTRARDNLQTGSLAYAAAKVWKRDGARVRLLVRREDGSGYFSRADLDAFDLDAMLERLRKTATEVHAARMAVVAGRLPKLREGDWCNFCPSYFACPAKVALARQLGAAPQTTVEEQVRDLLAPSTAAQAVERLRVIKRLTHIVEAEVRKYADAIGGIPMPNGMVFSKVVKQTPEYDGRIAYDYLEQRFGHEVAKLACKFETSAARIGRSLKGVAPKRGLTRLHGEVLDEIAAVEGGRTFKPRVSYEIHPAEDAAPQLEEPAQLEEEGAA